MTSVKDDKGSVEHIHQDAKGQYATGLKQSDNDGVSSAKPRVVTGSDDATAHKAPPGKAEIKKEWDVNYDEREAGEGDFRG